MDAKRFEELSRRIGTAADRRAAVRVLVGGVTASALALLQPSRGLADKVKEITTHNSIPLLHCRPQLSPCHDDRQCCSGVCKKQLTASVNGDPPTEFSEGDKNGVCDCKPSGATCYRLLEGTFCCSGQCTKEAKCA